MKWGNRRIHLYLFLACVAVMASGCATGKGTYQLTVPPGDEQKLARYSDLNLEVSAGKGVPLNPYDLERIKGRIERFIPEECPGRFKTIDPAEPGDACMKAEVKITNYDEGNAVARLMLAGLGQMHIDAIVTMTDYKTGEQLAKSAVSKTFAWGGWYGGLTQIKEIEDGFARGVAASLSGKKKESGPQSQ